MKKRSGKIGFWISTSMVVGNMTGSGIFLLPATLAVYGGISIFGWLFTLIGTIFIAFVFARLSKMITKAGGPYSYSREGFGDFAGFIVVWGYWISIWSGNAAIAVAGIGYLSVFIPDLKENFLLSGAMAVAAIWFFTYVNTKSIRSVGMVQLITTVLKILPLILLGTFGFIHFNSEYFFPLNLSGESDFAAISTTAAYTLWAFLGVESATIPSDKVQNPKVTIPRATIAGLLIAAVLYISSTVAIMGIVEPSELQNSAAPFADAAGKLWGNWASHLIAIGAVISCFGALNGWILMQGQIPMAAARDKLFPAAFMKLSKNGVPIVGVIIASILATILVGMNYSRGLVKMFSFIIMVSTITCLLPYLFSSLTEIALYLKKKKPYNRRKLISSILISVPAFLYSLWAITGQGRDELIWGMVLLAIGIPLYFIQKKYPYLNK